MCHNPKTYWPVLNEIRNSIKTKHHNKDRTHNWKRKSSLLYLFLYSSYPLLSFFFLSLLSFFSQKDIKVTNQGRNRFKFREKFTVEVVVDDVFRYLFRGIEEQKGRRKDENPRSSRVLHQVYCNPSFTSPIFDRVRWHWPLWSLLYWSVKTGPRPPQSDMKEKVIRVL